MAYVIESRAEVDTILSKASNIQIEFVAIRVYCQQNKEAIKKLGIGPKTIYKWPNYRELMASVNFLKREAVMGAVFALENLAPDAVYVLADALTGRDKRLRVQAAKEILSRCVPEKRETAITGGVSIDSVFEEALKRAYGGTELLDEPPTAIPTNGKASRVST